MISWDEKDVENYMVENMESEFGFLLIGRQINIGIGIIDVLAYDPRFKALIVFEIKKDLIDESAIGQIMRYMVGVQDYVSDLRNGQELQVKIVKGILVGKNITNTATTALRFVQDKIIYAQYCAKLEMTFEPIIYERQKESTDYRPDVFYHTIKETIEEANQEQEGDSNGEV